MADRLPQKLPLGADELLSYDRKLCDATGLKCREIEIQSQEHMPVCGTPGTSWESQAASSHSGIHPDSHSELRDSSSHGPLDPFHISKQRASHWIPKEFKLPICLSRDDCRETPTHTHRRDCLPSHLCMPRPNTSNLILTQFPSKLGFCTRRWSSVNSALSQLLCEPQAV